MSHKTSSTFTQANLHLLIFLGLLSLVCAAVIPEESGPQDGILRTKRYIGWGRRPGMRYSKAGSIFDFDNTFNKIYNRYEKRGQLPDSPISSFRELRMKQKVPNAQLLLPHLFQRNVRAEEGSDLELSQDELEALLLLLEEYQYQYGNPNAKGPISKPAE